MIKLSLKLTTIFISICLCLFGKSSYSANLVGDIKALVVRDLGHVDGDEYIYKFYRKNSNSAQGIDEDEIEFYEGRVIYNLHSIPNSLVMVQYQTGDNNGSLIKTKKEYGGIRKITFKSGGRLINFDKNGDAKLEINPKFFVGKNPYQNNFKAIYYITLIY